MNYQSFAEQFKEATKDVEYCVYCWEPRNGKMGCCQENHFVPFSDLYEDQQNYVIESEWDWANSQMKGIQK